MESRSHAQLKEKMAGSYKSKGFDTELEYRVENGLIVDVAAWDENKTIFIEIGALHGDNREEKLRPYCDKFIHIPQIDKPDVRDDSFTTVSFKKDFIGWLEENMDETKFSSTREFLKHLAIRKIESEKEFSDEKIKAVAEKLEEMGYMDR